jgi:fructosamine-3-kinase
MSKALQALIDSSRGTDLSYDGDFRIDNNVLAKFPKGTKLVSANRYGTSAWTVTARFELKLPDGSEEKYFLKSAPEEHGRILMEGEFNAMSELYKWAPDLVPKPHSWGHYELENPKASFFLAQYIEMSDRMPDPNQLCSKLARLHLKSHSPNNQFGFHITTCQGRIPQSVGWEKDWTTFFIKLLQHVVDLDVEVNGLWEELDKAQERLISKVIPRLLGALEKDGRKVKPCLIHADLWEGNTGTSFENDSIYIFDSAAFYAHNEMEVGDWRGYYNKISSKVYTKTYLKHYRPSEPKDEWDDRNRLYSIYYNVIYSVNHLNQGKAIRQLAYNDMCYLIDKFAPFPEGEALKRLSEDEMASLSEERDHTVT